MSPPEKPDASVILAAIKAKRDRQSSTAAEIAALEAALLADLENFDVEAADFRARRENLTQPGAGMADPTLVFPELAPTGSAPVAPRPSVQPAPAPEPPAIPAAAEAAPNPAPGGLLDQLRRQAEVRQRELHSAMAERTSLNEAIDKALKRVFFFLHELVQQLNIVKPEIARRYPLVEQHVLDRLSWQEGFADYRTQSQSAGALVELVSFSYHLSSKGSLLIGRDATAVERFRTTLFDYGLPFTCKEFKNDRRYVERAEFEIRSEVSVSARWKADFAKGQIVLETRNLERLGSALLSLAPTAIDQTLLDEFGRLVLDQPNRFRDLARRG